MMNERNELRRNSRLIMLAAEMHSVLVSRGGEGKKIVVNTEVEQLDDRAFVSFPLAHCSAE